MYASGGVIVASGHRWPAPVGYLASRHERQAEREDRKQLAFITQLREVQPTFAYYLRPRADKDITEPQRSLLLGRPFQSPWPPP